MPKKVVTRTGKHGPRQGTGQASCKEVPRPAHGSQVQKQFDLHCQHLVKTSDVYSDIPYVFLTGEQIERCRDAAESVYSIGVLIAKAEYRRQYKALIETDRTDLKARNDSGDLDAMKQWGKFCEDTFQLLLLRGMIFNKDVKVQQVHERYSPLVEGDPSQPGQAWQITDSVIKEMGRVTYAASDGVSGQGEVESKISNSDMLPDDYEVVLDMSQWVRKGAVHPVSNHIMKKCMAAMRRIHGNDIAHARQTCQILHDQVKDVDQDQLADQCQAGITKEALGKYVLFCNQCCQLAALWQILYDKPIPIRTRLDGVKRLVHVPDFDMAPPPSAALIVSNVVQGNLNQAPPSLSDKQILDMGKVTYAAYNDDEARNKGQATVTKHSDTMPGDYPVLLDMSQWVMKGAILCVNNRVMIHRMAQIRAFVETDELKARAAYQVLIDSVKEVNQEHMVQQAQDCKSEGAMDAYVTFCEQCFQLAALWQIIYNNPIPIKSSFEGLERLAFRIGF